MNKRTSMNKKKAEAARLYALWAQAMYAWEEDTGNKELKDAQFEAQSAYEDAYYAWQPKQACVCIGCSGHHGSLYEEVSDD